MKTLLFCLIYSLMWAGVHAGVDVKLKFHYNDYPLCNWEVRLEHNNSPIGSAVTDLKGVATFSDVTLFSKEVNAYLYRLPKDDPDKWNANGFIRLNDDYTGELDFGPIVASGEAPKSALEKAWNITLYECENMTPEDLHTIPDRTENVTSATNHTDAVNFDIEDFVLTDHEHRIESIKQELDIIDEKKQALLDAGKPVDVWKSKIYEAWLEELELHRQWADVKLRITNTQAHGESTVGMMGEEKALKARYLSAKEKREALQHEARKAVVEREDETGKSAIFGGKLNELRTELALKKQALRNEEDSNSPDARRIVELKGEIEKLERKINDLVE